VGFVGIRSNEPWVLQPMYIIAPTNGFVVRTGTLRLRGCFGGRLRTISKNGWKGRNGNSHDKRIESLE
jgi:hypothetical protein